MLVNGSVKAGVGVDELIANRYARVRSLGWGSMGEVWLADDTLLGRQVAVKIMRPGPEFDISDVERMKREARLAAHLQHPRVVSIYDLLLIDDRPIVIMEYVNGESLAARISRDGRLPVDTTARIGRDVILALASAHDAGIIHRDVKPANTMIDHAGRAKLADFGIARAPETPPSLAPAK